jgi:diguanylate cyclase (GGDEF)-like protein
MDPSGRNSILIVDDEMMNLKALHTFLKSEYAVYAAKNGPTAIEIANKILPDLILLDIMMQDMDGYEVLSILKNSDTTRDIPVIIITGLNGKDKEEKGLQLKAADYITKPFNKMIVELRVKNQIQMLNNLRTIELLSMMDQLTGLANRRSVDKQLTQEWARATRASEAMSILMIDLDKFKQYNDVYGHLQGDAALKRVAQVLRETLKRSLDFAARWGGEEFIVLLPGTDTAGAVKIAEEIRENIETAVVPLANGEDTRITVSIGVNTQAPTKDASFEEFFAKADEALYTAKEAGRNNVCHIADKRKS